MTTSNELQNRQKGSASLFVVIFAALLITTIVVGFVRIMVNDQKQATASDLAQSSYDAAQAGVEDAKRALIRYQTICSNDPTGTACSNAKAIIASNTCNNAVKTLSDVVPTGSGNEIKVQTKIEGSNALDQAYTCTKIAVDTPDFIGALSDNESKIIPLVTANGASFASVSIEWYNYKDQTSNNGSQNITLSNSSTSFPLLRTWVNAASNKPPIMRTQLVQANKNGFTLASLDSMTPTASARNYTAFLYPTSNGMQNSSVMTGYNRSNPREAVATRCLSTISGGGFACKMILNFNSGNFDSLLRLTTMYGKSNFRIKMYSLPNGGGSVVNFSGVQPSIDSTGRANDLYKRVQTRVELDDSSFAYPEAAVDITGNYCKNFYVTDVQSESRTVCSY